MQHLALVFTDLVDSTALNARLGDTAMQALWDWHDARSRELLLQFGGRETARSDGLVALFEQAEGAAGFAQAYQQAVASHPVGLKVRVGLHRGAVSVRENDHRALAVGAAEVDAAGLAKAVCARLMGLAAGGQVLASTAFVHALPPEAADHRSHGHWRLKGLDEPMEVHELPVDGHYGMAPADVEKAYRVVAQSGVWLALAARHSTLPPEASGFVGRRDELQALAAHLDEGRRLVSLLGTAGVGKTRLALRYAWGWAGAFAGGVFFCDLSPASDVDGVVSAVSRALDVPLGADALSNLGDALAGRGPCLLMLDNAEQVAEGVRIAASQWLLAAPRAQFLVTSRERLGLGEEQTLWLDTLNTEDATALFMARARAVRAKAVEDEAETVRQLVQKLDGLPLAIELAAARVSAFSPRVLLQRLSERFGLLSTRRTGDTGERQATLWTALDWSWRLLVPAERAALAQASIFAGPFDLDAAEAVMACDDAPAAAPVFDLLQSLCDKSLLRPLPSGRFALLQSVHDFAALRLAEAQATAGLGPAARDATRRRHLRHFARRTEAQVQAERGADLDDLAAACRGAADPTDMPDAVACLELAWFTLRRNGPFALATDLAHHLADRVADPLHRARVLWVLGSAQFAARSTAQARVSAEAGLQALGDTADPRLGARLHGLYGEVLSVQGAFDRAARQLDTAWDLAVQCNDASARCAVLNALGALAVDQGQAEPARLHYEHLLREAEAADDTQRQACALGNLAFLLMEAGAFGPAAERARRSLDLAQHCGEQRWAGNAHCNLGLIALETGQLEMAGAHLEQALALATRLGDRAMEVTTESNLGLLAERQGDLHRACERHRRAVAGAQRLSDPRLEAQLLACLVSALARAGFASEATDAVNRALVIAEECDVTTKGLVSASAAESYLASGNADTAAKHLRFAERVVKESILDETSELGRRVSSLRKSYRQLDDSVFIPD